MKTVNLVPRPKEEMQQLYAKLLGFLIDNPDYQYVETQDGILVVISPLKAELKGEIETPAKKRIIT